MMDITDAINALHPENSYVLRDDDYLQIEWVNAPENPATLEQVNAKLTELQAEYDSKSYARARAIAYDPIPEQLDQIYHDIDGWKARIKAVKDKYPKPK